MLHLKRILIILSLSFFCIPAVHACFSSGSGCPRGCCGKENTCCEAMGGVSYCDSSAGRLVCNNGYYSSCYCTRHAVMNLQFIQGCCVWQGGVRNVNQEGKVICRNGAEAELCSIQSMQQKPRISY